MIFNKINLSHVQRNHAELFLLEDVLNAIGIQRNEAYQDACTFSRVNQLPKWVNESQARQLANSYDEAINQFIKDSKRASQQADDEHKKLIYVEFGRKKVALFKVDEAINEVMSISDIKEYIEAHRPKLNLPDLEQSTGVLYALALSKCKQARVKNNV